MLIYGWYEIRVRKTTLRTTWLCKMLIPTESVMDDVMSAYQAIYAGTRYMIIAEPIDAPRNCMDSIILV